MIYSFEVSDNIVQSIALTCSTVALATFVMYLFRLCYRTVRKDTRNILQNAALNTGIVGVGGLNWNLSEINVKAAMLERQLAALTCNTNRIANSLEKLSSAGDVLGSVVADVSDDLSDIRTVFNDVARDSEIRKITEKRKNKSILGDEFKKTLIQLAANPMILSRFFGLLGIDIGGYFSTLFGGKKKIPPISKLPSYIPPTIPFQPLHRRTAPLRPAGASTQANPFDVWDSTPGALKKNPLTGVFAGPANSIPLFGKTVAKTKTTTKTGDAVPEEVIRHFEQNDGYDSDGSVGSLFNRDPLDTSDTPDTPNSTTANTTTTTGTGTHTDKSKASKEDLELSHNEFMGFTNSLGDALKSLSGTMPITVQDSKKLLEEVLSNPVIDKMVAQDPSFGGFVDIVKNFTASDGSRVNDLVEKDTSNVLDDLCSDSDVDENEPTTLGPVETEVVDTVTSSPTDSE